MNDKLVLIHTVTPLIDVFNELGLDLLPKVQVFHILDEPLLESVRVRGGLNEEHISRLLSHVENAERIGASAVLVTCSTLSPGVDPIHSSVSIPLLKIDEGMVTRAVELGNVIGVVATNQTTLEPTRSLLSTKAMEQGKKIETRMVLVKNALQALLNGDGHTHDGLVKQAVVKVAEEVEVVVLAQASMARVLNAIPESDMRVPILSSPHIALEQIRVILKQT